ncbi:putative glycosyltransferase [Rubidibacter lacunae KORDI 51-2]|uniref:Putative glycosyltransferase n=1 Tax=Rubidibacter lacunae KORDI 51-2 TaxID=582515 RepID=U5DNG8_9CHRO|nr:glycosyltransferase family 2 protein [Rubidibacter lacunae]ERN42144.1 putative glycosyltransferase [Rubidibacter lacunae KORDI 51-2]
MRKFYLLVVSYYSSAWLARLIDSLDETPPDLYQLVVVNNARRDRELRVLLQAFPRISLLEAHINLGFGRGCNLGLQWIWGRDRYARVWAINPDASFLPDTIVRAREVCNRHPELAILGTQIYKPDGTVWFARGTFARKLGVIRTVAELPPAARNPSVDLVTSDWASACSTIINLARFETCPQFDPEFFLYYEDFDFCQRYIMQGHRLAVATQVAVIHQPSTTVNRFPVLKFEHATFSYLLVLERYASGAIVWLYFTRLLVHALVLRLLCRPAGRGKLAGVARYLRYIPPDGV